jgi:hypothetical protein
MKQLVPVFVLASLSVGSTSCSRATTPAPASTPTQGQSQAVLPDLTEDERLLTVDLERHLSFLAKAGERNEAKSWPLAEVADYIAMELEEMGLVVERQGYETESVAAQNLAVTISGEERGDQILVVAAHYDSPVGDTGIVAGGTGTATLLALVKLMKDARLKRTLRFVFFAMGESPHGDAATRGARHYARYLQKSHGEESGGEVDGMPITRRSETVGLLNLDRLGSFAPEHGAGAPLTARLTSSGGSEVLRGLFLEDIDGDVLRIVETQLDENGPDSDLLAFHQAGIPGVALTGTGGQTEAVQYEQLARVITQIRRGIRRLAGERPTNDGMLTPLSEQIR